jgi:hypothetical protein
VNEAAPVAPIVAGGVVTERLGGFWSKPKDITTPFPVHAVPVPAPAPVAVKERPTVSLEAPIAVKSVVPMLAMTYVDPTVNDPAVTLVRVVVFPALSAETTHSSFLPSPESVALPVQLPVRPPVGAQVALLELLGAADPLVAFHAAISPV